MKKRALRITTFLFSRKSQLVLLPLLALTCMTAGCASTHWSEKSGGSSSSKSDADLAALVHGMSTSQAHDDQVRINNIVDGENESNPRNIVVPFREYSVVSLELSPCSQSESEITLDTPANDRSITDSFRQSLSGSYRFSLSRKHLAGKAFAEIALEPDGTFSDERTRTYTPTHFALGANSSAGYVFFDLLPHEKNRLTIDSDGTGKLQVRLLMSLPKSLFSITNEVWLEIPATMKSNQLSLTAVDAHRLDIAPKVKID